MRVLIALIVSFGAFAQNQEPIEFGVWESDVIEAYSSGGKKCGALAMGYKLVARAVGVKNMKFNCPSYGSASFQFSALQWEEEENSGNQVEVEWTSFQLYNQVNSWDCSIIADAAIEMLDRLVTKNTAYQINCSGQNSFIYMVFESLTEK